MNPQDPVSFVPKVEDAKPFPTQKQQVNLPYTHTQETLHYLPVNDDIRRCFEWLVRTNTSDPPKVK